MLFFALGQLQKYPVLVVLRMEYAKTGTFWSWRFMADGEIFIISTTSYQRFAREIPNELNESDVFGENNLRQTVHQIFP